MEYESHWAPGWEAHLYIPGEAKLDDRTFLRAVAIAVEEAGVECHWETFVEEDTVPDAARLTLWLEG